MNGQTIAAVGGPRRAGDSLAGRPSCRGHDTSAPAPVSSTFRRLDGRVVAEMRGDTLACRRRGSMHMLRYPLAWAFDADILRTAEAAGAVFAEVLDLDTGSIYRTTLEDFRRHGLTLNRGVWEQIALPLGRWSLLKLGAPRQYDLGLDWGD